MLGAARALAVADGESLECLREDLLPGSPCRSGRFYVASSLALISAVAALRVDVRSLV